jgi:uncharacterized protein involved in propanediol utilization
MLHIWRGGEVVTVASEMAAAKGMAAAAKGMAAAAKEAAAVLPSLLLTRLEGSLCYLKLHQGM